MLHLLCEWQKDERSQRQLNPMVSKAVGEALFHLSAPRFLNRDRISAIQLLGGKSTVFM